MEVDVVLSYRTLFRAPSAGDVASPPFGGRVIAQVWQSVCHQQATWHPLGRGHSPSISFVCNLPLISGDVHL